MSNDCKRIDLQIEYQADEEVPMAKRIIFLSSLMLSLTLLGSCVHKHPGSCAHQDAACASCKDASKNVEHKCSACKEKESAEKHDCSTCKDSK